jgi:hypothetical protein
MIETDWDFQQFPGTLRAVTDRRHISNEAIGGFPH